MKSSVRQHMTLLSAKRFFHGKTLRDDQTQAQ